MPVFKKRKPRHLLSMEESSLPPAPIEKPVLLRPYTSFDAIDNGLLLISAYKIVFSLCQFYSWDDVFGECYVSIPFFLKSITKFNQLNSSLCYFFSLTCFFLIYTIDFFRLHKRSEGAIFSIFVQLNFFLISWISSINDKKFPDCLFSINQNDEKKDYNAYFISLKKIICRNMLTSSSYFLRVFSHRSKLLFYFGVTLACLLGIKSQLIFCSIGLLLINSVERFAEKNFEVYDEEKTNDFFKKINNKLNQLCFFNNFIDNKSIVMYLLDSTFNELLDKKMLFDELIQEKKEFYKRVRKPVVSVTFYPSEYLSIVVESIVSVFKDAGFQCFLFYNDDQKILLVDLLSNLNCTENFAEYFCHEILSKINIQRKARDDLKKIEKNLTDFISYRISNGEPEYLFSDREGICRSLVNHFEKVSYDANEKIYIASQLRDEPLLSPSLYREPIAQVDLFPTVSLSSSISSCIKSTLKRTGRKLDEVSKTLDQSLSFFSRNAIKKTYQWKNYFQECVLLEGDAPENFVFWRNRSAMSSQDQVACVYWDVKTLGQNFVKGSDEALLFAAFKAQSKNGLRSFGVRSDGAHIYELRGQCEKRILGVEIQEPGETPLIFLMLSCNHSGLQKSITAIRPAEIKAYAMTVLQKSRVVGETLEPQLT